MENNIKTIFCVAKTLSKAIIENGGEIYRAEEAICRMKSLDGIESLDTIALPTGIFITITSKGGETLCEVCRFKARGLDLNAIDHANNIARQIESGSLSAEDALIQLSSGCKPSKNRFLFSSFSSALTIGCFCLLMGGGVFDFFISALCAFTARYVSRFFTGDIMYNFIVNITCGALCAIISALCVTIFRVGSLDIIIGSSILAFLPGMALVTAIRDCIHGDLISGMARLGDVLVISLALASGIGIVLWISGLFGGVA